MTMTRTLQTVLILLLLGGSASTTVAQDTAPAPVSASRDSLYSGDIIKLWIWREDQLSGAFPVPENGMVVFPKLGPIKVTGIPAGDLKGMLITEYQKYLRNPAIEVSFLRRINVLGAVKAPGVYTVEETMTIAHAVALAGGANTGGKPDEVQLFRGGQRLVARISGRTLIGDLQIRSGDQLWVPERSWVSRNAPLVASVISGMVGVAVTILVQKN
jgi:protein involved in polysaccharide export with SLBB domain